MLPTRTSSRVGHQEVARRLRVLHSRSIKNTRTVPPDGAINTLPPPRLDYKSIIENEAYHVQNIANRKLPGSGNLVEKVKELHQLHSSLVAGVNEIRQERNTLARNVKMAKTSEDRAAALQRANSRSKNIKDFLAIQEPMTSGAEIQLLHAGLQIPNITHPDSPVGPESAAKVLSTHGPERLPTDAARDHAKVGKELGIISFDEAAAVTGSAWYYLRGAGALLEQALVNYALQIAIKHGFTPVIPPDVIKADYAARCGFAPRDEPDQHGKVVHHFYHLQGTSNNLVLAGTAEIPLAGMFAQRTFLERELPARVVAVGHAFRSEAGSRGAVTRGLYRVHQFTKVELFAVTEQNQSSDMMEELRKIQIEIFGGLGFPFRVLDMPTEELGHAAYRKYDMEAWMPGRGGWGEISSTSNCLDFQARRLHIQYRTVQTSNKDGLLPQSDEADKRITFAHTLNGTAAAIPRLIVALLENGVVLNQSKQVVELRLPSCLRRYWLGNDSLGPAVSIRWIDQPITT
ncbi:Serine--tRNA ligase, mitochondrial; AltName: Full=Digs into agar protein 4; AltName: Full=Seryl-tRNA synthetase; Short=SerRS; AltName: Full=Seryl-tRNA(Ser/Sec) synthetase [Serendipita indica DSM 11827]|uniref:serine--tRNA ligase n=1 Tax=Serendipita indica (strain DSM 11827) TaxID=1109443 RepID=G4U2R9_SERID|nr:Serine--tRNA ligase, mitochondrial; AltName: Full=Digs into agar protein 4; AltName: Full=Seryl-tRNA synthetase; Short=SerRS; AltName: Full=Seryl-tRNA(Ser/Sec) synthetase [Serendipita indica DSM 11827]CCA77910.1 related to mitochondrial seryl-tRNA synthetases [Serendipita indica DSM 11827]